MKQNKQKFANNMFVLIRNYKISNTVSIAPFLFSGPSKSLCVENRTLVENLVKPSLSTNINSSLQIKCFKYAHSKNLKDKEVKKTFLDCCLYLCVYFTAKTRQAGKLVLNDDCNSK